MRKTRILVVDDEHLIRWSLEQNLRKQGYDLLTAGTGEDAIKIVREEQPELVLLDIQLPGISGLEVLEKIKEIDEDIIATIVRAMNRLNRYLLGPERHERRLGAVFFWERGKNGRPHVHGLVERPEHVRLDDFIDALRRAWQTQPFGYREVMIEPIRSLGASFNYDSKAGFHHLVYFHKHDPLKGHPSA